MKFLKPSVIPFLLLFTKACYITLHRAVTILLLVRQQIKCIDQIFTQDLRYDLGLTGTFALFAPPAACLAPSNHTFLHRPHTTSWCASFPAETIMAHSVAFAWTEDDLYSQQPPPFIAKKACFIILEMQSVSLQHFTCFKYSLAGDSRAFLSRHPLETSLLSVSHKQSTPTSFLVCTGLFPAVSITFHDAPSSPRPRTTASSSRVLSPFPTRFLL